MDSAGSDRPQRRTALVGRELGRYGIEIAALSETRFAEIGEIKEVGAGYTFFWSGRKTEERREAGVGFAIKSDLVGKLTGSPNGINDRLMTLRLPLSGNKHATIVSAYAKINWPGSLRSTPFLALVPRCSIYILDYEQRWVKSITNL